MALIGRIIERLAGGYIADRVALAVKENDSAWAVLYDRGQGPNDRPYSERQDNLADALEAWHVNPLARRIVALTTDYVVGSGIRVCSSTRCIEEWIKRFWAHPKNRMALRTLVLCDELTRAGEIFPVLFTNRVDGMSYERSISAREIDEVRTLAGDYETAVSFHQVAPRTLAVEGRTGVAFDNPDRELVGRPREIMLHLAVKRPVGATRGSGDLAPVLKWLKRYNSFLEARL